MADLISRLKLESGEFESKIARATKGLLTMEKECREVGGTLAILDKEQLEFVRGLGQMETVTQNAKGKVAELTAAYTELSIQYNRLTKEEKNGDYGRALASSLDQLKRRIKDSKSELAGVEGSLTGVGDAFKQLGNRIGIPMEVFSKFGPILAAVGAAAKVAKDAFFANESMVDEWGRTVESAKSIYEGFVTSLNTGDFGGFLSRMSSISAAARKAYDELDRLGTMKTIQSPEMSRLQAENERNRMMLQTRRYIAPLDGSDGIPGMKNGQLLSDAQVKSIESELKNGIQRIAELVTNEVQQTTNAIEAEYNRQANVIGLDLDEFKKGTSSMAEFDSMLKLAKKYSEFENEHTVAQQSIDNMGMLNTTYIRDNAANPYQQYKGWNVFRVDGDKFKELVTLIQQRDQQMVQAYSMQSQAYRAINRAEGVSVRGGNTTPVEPVLPEGSAAALRKQISDLQKQWDIASTQDERNSLDGQIKAAEEALKAMTPQIEPVAAAIKDAAAMWTEHSQKIADVKARLEEFKAMVTDTSLTDAQRDWAQGMADSYQQQLDKMTGATEEAANNISKSLDKIPTKFELIQKSLDKMSTGVGAISTLGNSFNELKSIGDDLASAFSGEMDSWDALMTVFNSGIGIMETVIGVMEAINTLQELSSTLSKKKVTDQATETAAVVSGKMAESTANIQEAGTSMLSAGANTAESSTAAGKAVANIPIVGPILAVAAIAAVLGAAIGAMSKAKSAGHFATGGIVPGNDYSDNTPVLVSSGELILNRAQQGAIAGQLQNNNPLGNLQLTSKVRGSDLLIVLDNTNSSRGGKRGIYANVRI